MVRLEWRLAFISEDGRIISSFMLSYRDTSLTRKRLFLGPYSRVKPRAFLGSEGGGRFLMSEITMWALMCGDVRLVIGILE